jgi:polyisoprenoid-binding protein YceI
MRWVLIISALFVSGCVSAPTRDPVELPDGNWQLDPLHSSVIWRSRHFGLSWYTARFDTLGASLTFDPDQPEAARLTAIINADSVSTGNSEFDRQLRGPNWFSAEHHPQIIFETTRIVLGEDGNGQAFGDLTIRGITRPATMNIHFYGGTYNFLENSDMIGFAADMVLSRREFGIGSFIPSAIAGDEVRIRIEAEFLLED